MSDATRPAGLTVATFNIWGIPIASYASLSRPGRLGDVAAAAVLDSSPPPGDRVVLCFQEAWAFKTGCGQPCIALARCLERSMPSMCLGRYQQIFNPRHLCREIFKVNSVCTLMASVFAAMSTLCFPCSTLHDDVTRDEIAESLKLWGLHHAVGIGGIAGIHASRRTLMDSGLLIVSSIAPVASGFTSYECVGVEGVANKGYMWVLLPPTDPALGDGLSSGGQLIITTHHHADQINSDNPGAIRTVQRTEMLAGISKLRAQYRPALVVACGDFNEDAEPRPEGGGLVADFKAEGYERLTGITKGIGTCIRDDGSGRCDELDHLFAAGDHIDHLVCEPAKPLRTPWSDHSVLWVNRLRLPAAPVPRTELI